MSKLVPNYFEWAQGDTYYEVEHDDGLVVVTQDTLQNTTFVGAFRFENGTLVEAIARGVLPDALCDEIESRWASGPSDIQGKVG